MTDPPGTMSRRQLIRHSAWFGAAVGLAVWAMAERGRADKAVLEARL